MACYVVQSIRGSRRTSGKPAAVSAGSIFGSSRMLVRLVRRFLLVLGFEDSQITVNHPLIWPAELLITRV